MSIATMKKKTQAQYYPHSVGPDGFSINGTQRNQGYVGQTMLSRSLPRTLMKGNTMRGSGGCCGNYNISPVIQSAINSTEDPAVVKSSVLGTSGMISTKYRWTRRPQPFSVVKPDNHQNRNSQGDYISILKRKTLSNISSCNNPDGTKPLVPGIQCCSLLKTNNFNIPSIHITKQTSDYAPVSYSEYLMQLDKECTGNDYDYSNIKNGIGKTPIPVCGHS
jgi:hypothetical protein